MLSGVDCDWEISVVSWVSLAVTVVESDSEAVLWETEVSSEDVEAGV